MDALKPDMVDAVIDALVAAHGLGQEGGLQAALDLLREHGLEGGRQAIASLLAQIQSARLPFEPRPTVVCFCGSTRFTREMMLLMWDFAKRGIIALGWCVLPEGYFDGDGVHGAELEGCKEQLDSLHRRKIDLADQVLVLNIGGYIGESTRDEIAYAKSIGKPVAYLEPRTA